LLISALNILYSFCKIKLLTLELMNNVTDDSHAYNFICIPVFLRFHVAARKGLINSLNVFLENGVNLKAVDAAGKTF